MMLTLSSSGHAMQTHVQSGRHVRATRNPFASSSNSIVCSRQLRSPSSTLRRRFALLTVRGSKEDLEKRLDLTQTTLDRVLQQIAASQPQSNGSISDATFSSREQQLWERQQSLLDRLQHHWDLERQAWLQERASWHERESSLLKELASLRSELQAAAAAAAAGSAVGSHPPAAASSSSSSRPGLSDLAASAVINSVISGPSSASAAVADAIRAVRDAHVRGPPKDLSSSSSGRRSSSSSDGGIDLWQDLFNSSTAASSSSSSSSSALDSVDAATAAVDDTDKLSGVDPSHSSGSSSNTNNGTGAAAAAGPSSSGSGPIETIKGDPTGPPPLLAIGDDDIYWISKLHNGLMTAGFYPADDEIENWVFAEGTQSALLTFQACNGVSETGTSCESTWRKLLGEDYYENTYGSSSSSSTATSAPAAASSSSNGDSSSSSSSDVVIVEEESETVMFSFSGGGSSSSSSSSSAARSGSSSSSSTWPVLMDMDGGREVHALQVSLDKAGFFCGDDEMRWWQFGSSTGDALKTFQACNSLPESGVCDERTWLKLLGPDAKSEDLELVHGDESTYEDDMTESHEGAVWLLGEQRWTRPANGNNS